MERTLFLVLALIGYAISGFLVFAEASEVAFVAFGVATVPLLVWIIALGIDIGLRDARSHQDESGSITEQAERWRKARYGD